MMIAVINDHNDDIGDGDDGDGDHDSRDDEHDGDDYNDDNDGTGEDGHLKSVPGRFQLSISQPPTGAKTIAPKFPTNLRNLRI